MGMTEEDKRLNEISLARAAKKEQEMFEKQNAIDKIVNFVIWVQNKVNKK